MHKIRFLILAFCLGIVACAKENEGRKVASAGKPQSANNISHKVQQCPKMNGTFVLETKKTAIKKIQTKLGEAGVTLSDSDLVWQIDGASHIFEENRNLFYKGLCSEQKIVIDLFENKVFLGKMNYYFISKTKLVIELMVKDPRLGESFKDIWVQEQPEAIGLAADLE